VRGRKLSLLETKNGGEPAEGNPVRRNRPKSLEDNCPYRGMTVAEGPDATKGLSAPDSARL
jgi:hypothetical protein